MVHYFQLSDAQYPDFIIKREQEDSFLYAFGLKQWQKFDLASFSDYREISAEEAEMIIKDKDADYLSLQQKAVEIATEAHQGQTDRAGKDYIHHPLTVAENVLKAKQGLDYYIVGVLHDVLEDSDFQAEDLEAAGFPPYIIEGVEYLTKADDFDYQDYIEQIKQNRLARFVKIEDLKHNMDLSRLKKVKDSDYKRLEKYKKALQFLQS